MVSVTPGDPLAPFELGVLDVLPAGVDAAPRNLGHLGKEYEILEIKRGGMGEVYICRQINGEGPRVAFKTYQKRFFFNRANRDAFKREVSIWLRLTGLYHIMPALGIEQFDERPFVLMPAVEPGPSGEVTLRDLVRRGPLPFQQVLQFAEETARGLGDADERIPGIVHGDIKPDNLLLWDERVRVSDFGLAQIATDQDVDDPLESTWAYRAPELWEAGAKASHASDMYAFGVLFYEILTGRTPFLASSRTEWAHAHCEITPEPPPGFPEEGAEASAMNLALRALAKNPLERPIGFAKLADEIAEIDPALRLMSLLSLAVKAAKASESSREPRYSQEERERGLLAMRVRNLLEHRDAAQALAELDAAPEKLIDTELLILRGSALSLLNRDEEAVRCFEVARSGEMSPRLREMWMNELALSLKRLKRFEEAIQIYKDLLREMPESRMEGPLTNLAGVYLQSGWPEEALKCIGNFAITHPTSYRAWVHLGTAFRDLGQYDDAGKAFEQALRAEPGQPMILIAAAEVQLLQKQPERALATLELAYRQGFTSNDWYIVTQACHLVMGRMDRFDALKKLVEPQFSPAEFENLQEKITALAKKASADPSGGSTESAPEHDVLSTEHDRRALARRVHSHLQRDNAAQALAELDAAPPELVDADLLIARGGALMEVGRHEEAVHCLETVLAGDLSQEQRQDCMNTLGLTLKRLKRFDEAAQIYTAMLRDAKESDIERAVINLSGVYVENGKPEDAVKCLQPFLSDHPDSVRVLGNLGVAYRDLGQYDAAEEAFHRAHRLDPNNGWVLVKSAEVHLLRMRPDKAAAALHRAYEQNYRGLSLLAAMYVFLLITGDEEGVDALKEEAQRTVTNADDLDELNRRIVALAKKVSEAQSAHSDKDTPERDVARNVQSFKMPFTNIRVVEHENMYVLDRYDDVKSDEYSTSFAKALQESARGMAVQIGNFVLRTTPFYFTICPSCAIEILTNRDHSAPLRCRRCDRVHETAPMVGRAELSSLLDKVVVAIGKKLITSARVVIVLLKVDDDTKKDRINVLAHEAGFEPISTKHAGVLWLRAEYLKRGALKPEDEYLAYQKLIEEGVADYEDQTPQVFEHLLRRIRAECGGLVSASLVCDPGDHSPQSLMQQGRLDEALTELRRRLTESPGDLDLLYTLVSILVQKGDLEEARAQAELATRIGPANAALWSSLGMVELELERFEEAASACERAIQLDPLDRLGLIFLANAYAKLGREAEASELWHRVRTYGVVA